MLQCVALQCVAVCSNWFFPINKMISLCVTVRCSVVQCGAVWCSVVQCVAVWCSVVQCVAV